MSYTVTYTTRAIVNGYRGMRVSLQVRDEVIVRELRDMLNLGGALELKVTTVREVELDLLEEK